MPWTKKQQRVAQAVKHDWKPKGSAKGFTKAFAEEVVDESKTMRTRPPVSEASKRQKRAERMLGKGAHAAVKRGR
jgi:hypothetical protein